LSRYASTKLMPEKTPVFKICPEGSVGLVENACNRLHSGGVIAVPTDTVYGFAALAQSSAAIGRLYEVKGRELTKPIAISVASVIDAYKWGRVTVADQLLDELLPGPVTVVFERKSELNPALNPGTSLVGIRVPDSGFVCDIARRCGQPLALTSANFSAQPSSLSVQEFDELWPRLDAVFDAGLLSKSEQSKKGSTVVDLSKRGFYTIIRDGSAYEITVKLLKKYGLKEDKKS
jgi:tRNA threonylcarbamoyl adenosine modification protein (Sua5/YciO/YrdC/YwlC family)